MDFLKSKWDNISLAFFIVLLICVMIWADRQSSDKFLAWLEQTTTTVLGAYIGLTQAARVAWKSNGGTNGTTVDTTISGTGTVSTSTAK